MTLARKSTTLGRAFEGQIGLQIPFEVWSGGQTGVDRGALEGARGVGVKTGGFAPLGWKTELGPAPELGNNFGLLEHASSDYPPRTRENVRRSDATVIIAKNFFERGTELTTELAAEYGKPTYQITFTGCPKDPFDALHHEAFHLAWWLATYPDLRFVNFAGNRESKAPGIQAFTRWLLALACNMYLERMVAYGDQQPLFLEGVEEPAVPSAEEAIEDATAWGLPPEKGNPASETPADSVDVLDDFTVIEEEEEVEVAEP